MAIIHTTPKQSGTEALLKILSVITDAVKLSHGKVLMGQFACGETVMLKMSLYVTENTCDYIGVRNVFLQDVRDTVVVRVGSQQEEHLSKASLLRLDTWIERFPATHTAAYPLTRLDQAAMDVRDYLLFGQRPDSERTDSHLFLMPKKLEGKYMVFDILPTLDL